MAYIPGCGADVFISYAHEDKDWVAKAKDRLVTTLASYLTPRVQVWFDTRIDPGREFRQEIREKLEQTPVFLAVVSPNYLQSEFCIQEELEWFRSQGGVRHVVQLVKVPLEREHLEVPIPEVQYVTFYDEEERALTGARLNKKLDAVALAIANLLRDCRSARPKVYVAQVTDEALKTAWNRLKEGLHEAGYTVLPAQVLPTGFPDRRIQEWLEECCLSVHLTGVHDDSLAARQREIASRTSRPLKILDRAPRDEEVGAVIAQIRAALQAPRRTALYFVYDDLSDGRRVSDLSRQIGLRTGMDVLPPGPSPMCHKERLEGSDGILLFRAEAPEDWRLAQEQKLRQCLALRRDRAVPVAWYHARPADGSPAAVHVDHTSPKEWVIERTGDVDVGDLQPFLEALPR
jgi:TIR domain